MIFNIFNFIWEKLVENILVYFFFFSFYLLGSRSGSIWTFLGSWIRIRMKTKVFMWIRNTVLNFLHPEAGIYKTYSQGLTILSHS